MPPPGARPGRAARPGEIIIASKARSGKFAGAGCVLGEAQVKANNATPEELRELAERAAELANSATQYVVSALASPLADLTQHLSAWLKEQLALSLPTASELARQLMNPLTAAIKELTAPGTFWGDVILVHSEFGPEAERALDRLAAAPYFSRRAVFHPARWQFLEERFVERKGDLPWDAAWTELVRPNLLMAIRSLDEDEEIESLYAEIRKRVRASIESDLLNTTVNELCRHPTHPWPEEDTPEAKRLEEQLRMEWVARLDNQIAIQQVLAELDPSTRRALFMHAYGNLTLKDAALLNNLSPGALRLRLHRLRQKLS